VVVAVKAAGVNFPDTLIIQGKYQFKPEPPFSPGGEVAGVVKVVGEGVTSVKVGDHVIAASTFGGFAEEMLCDADRLVPMPAGDGVRARLGVPAHVRHLVPRVEGPREPAARRDDARARRLGWRGSRGRAARQGDGGARDRRGVERREAARSAGRTAPTR
jgi:hypothetical protein